MNNAYIPTLVANRLVLSLERKNWELAEEAANELADLCDGDWQHCRSFVANALGRSSGTRSSLRSQVNREARLACERLVEPRLAND